MPMKLRRRIIFGILCSVPLAALALYHFSRRTTTVLNGYQLFHADNHSTSLSNSRGEVVVTQEVEAVGVLGPYIVGRSTGSDYAHYQDPPEPTGYFVVDTAAKRVHVGLSREEAQGMLPNGEFPALWSPYLWSFVP